MTPEQKVWLRVYTAVLSGLIRRTIGRELPDWQRARSIADTEANEAVKRFREVNPG